jgi:hypothetical protein
MRLDSLFPFLLVVAISCGGDDDDDAIDAAPGTTIDAAAPDAGDEPDAGTSADGGVDGAKCGGPKDLKCAESHFCDWEDDSCGGNREPGSCAPRPTDCQPGGPPVCGCDGKAYDSECEAEKAGTDVAQQGICKPTLR